MRASSSHSARSPARKGGAPSPAWPVTPHRPTGRRPPKAWAGEDPQAGLPLPRRIGTRASRWGRHESSRRRCAGRRVTGKGGRHALSPAPIAISRGHASPRRFMRVHPDHIRPISLPRALREGSRAAPTQCPDAAETKPPVGPVGAQRRVSRPATARPIEWAGDRASDRRPHRMLRRGTVGGLLGALMIFVPLDSTTCCPLAPLRSYEPTLCAPPEFTRTRLGPNHTSLSLRIRKYTPGHRPKGYESQRIPTDHPSESGDGGRSENPKLDFDRE
jgi:hypothetical protein